MKTIVIADKHAVFRSALKSALKEFNVIGEAADFNSALDLIKQLRPDLLLLDISIPGFGRISRISEIKNICRDTKILIVTFEGRMDLADQALKQGADGYFMKGESLQAFNKAISCVLNNETYLSPDLSAVDHGHQQLGACPQDNR